MTLEEQLILHEGIRLRMYRDSVGHNSIGVGHNLDANGISHEEAMSLLRDDIANARRDLLMAFPWFATLSEMRQRVLIDMCFNLGLAGLRTFHQTLATIETGDYVGAASAMLQSLWAHQVGRRATRLALMMLNDKEAS